MVRVPLLLVCGTIACTAQAPVDSASARAVLSALTDAKLSAHRAHDVCQMAGNQGPVRKENSYGVEAITESCADALLAAAQDGSTPRANRAEPAGVSAVGDRTSQYLLAGAPGAASLLASRSSI